MWHYSMVHKPILLPKAMTILQAKAALGEKLAKLQMPPAWSEFELSKNFFGNHAVCTEQGASVSHLTAAKALDLISRLPGCSGQATDAVSAYTQVEMKDAPERVHQSEEDWAKIRIRVPKARGPHK